MSLAKCSTLLGPSLCLTLALPPPALSQELPPAAPVPEAPPASLPDAVFRSVVERPVALQLVDGSELVGRILTVEPELLVISIAATGQVITLPRARVARVRLLAAPPPPPTTAAVDTEQPLVPTVRPRQRHFALNLSIAPGLDLDLDYGLFHAFANLGIVLPLASNGAVVPFALGLGVGIPVSSRHRALKLDLFGYLSVIGSTQSGSYSSYGSSSSSPSTLLAFGVGLGLHHTWNNGLTLGFTVPILGYSVIAGQSGSSAYSSSSGTSQGLAYFFLASSEALPLGYIGYRF